MDHHIWGPWNLFINLFSTKGFFINVVKYKKNIKVADISFLHYNKNYI